MRAIDEILKTEFDLPQGIADSSKIKIKVNLQGKMVEQEVHRVQMLDPATGTATYIAEVIKEIYKKFEGQQGSWSTYVENHLLPRLIGFELLMASYAMAHLQIDLLLKETGFVSTRDQRLKIYLTNSLEESHPDTGTLFANWLSNEANEANRIKRDVPVMIVMGNPPYSGESANKGEWIMKLMEDYKKEPGGKEKLKEQNSKFINDDYVKFIRYGQHFIEKNGSGVLAFINPHGFLDNPTFRGMRWNLLKTFDKIYTIDLHGNSKKKETAPDGSADVNVFDIEQGVSINFFIKTGKKKPNELGQVFHYDLFGKRELKYDFLLENSIETIKFDNFTPFKSSFLFKKIDETELLKYNNGINPIELFKINVMGFQTHRDEFCIDDSKNALAKKLFEFSQNKNSEFEIENEYCIKSSTDFNIRKAQEVLLKADLINEIISCGYRPFDSKYIYFDKIVVDRPRKELLIHSKNKENILLGIGRQGLAIGDIEWCLTTVSRSPVDANIFRRGGVNLFPLYLYPEQNAQQTIGSGSYSPPLEGLGEVRIPNLNTEIVKQISDKLGLRFVSEKENVTSPNPSKGGGQDAVSDNLRNGGSGVSFDFTKENVTFPNPSKGGGQDIISDFSKGGGQDAVSNFCESVVKNNLGENVLHPTFGGDGGGQTLPNAMTTTNNSKGGGQDVASDIYDGGKSKQLAENVGRTEAGYITANPHNYPYIKDIREELKKNPTEAEKIIWEYLRAKKTGYKIRRQHIIDNFIADFVCLSKKVVIEIDGKIHLQQKEQDELRTYALNDDGYKVIRFTNDEVLTNPQSVANQIKKILDDRQTVIQDDESDIISSSSSSFLSPSFGGVRGGQNPESDTTFGGVRGGQIVDEGTFAPIDILDYIYVVLHSPSYREKYKEFLKIDFPRVPYPKDKETFWQLVKLGGEIRQIHLLESPIVDKRITQYPISGDNIVIKPRFSYSPPSYPPPLEGLGEVKEVGKVYINETQYFDNVPEVAWNFYTGGYQPAQKWLKDRKDRILEYEDLNHYQKIIVALTETDRLMKAIDTIEIE